MRRSSARSPRQTADIGLLDTSHSTISRSASLRARGGSRQDSSRSGSHSPKSPAPAASPTVAERLHAQPRRLKAVVQSGNNSPDTHARYGSQWIHPAHCTVEGEGIASPEDAPASIAGDWTTFTITAHDKLGQRKRTGGEAFHVFLTKTATWSHRTQLLESESSAKDLGDGRYIIKYRTAVPGLIFVHIRLITDSHASRSPTINHSVVAATVRAYTAAPQNRSKSSSRSRIGRAGGELHSGDYHTTTSQAAVGSSSNSSGSKHTSTSKNPMGVDRLTLDSQHVASSPYCVRIDPAPFDMDRSDVDGVFQSESGSVASFTIRLRDRYGNRNSMDQLRLVRVMASLTSHAVPNENRPPAASVAGVSPLKLSGGGVKAGGGPSSSQIMSQQLTCHLSEDTSVMAASEGVVGTGYYVVSYQVDTVGYYNILVTTTHSESSSFKNVGLGFSPAAYTRRDNQLHSPGRIAMTSPGRPAYPDWFNQRMKLKAKVTAGVAVPHNTRVTHGFTFRKQIGIFLDSSFTITTHDCFDNLTDSPLDPESLQVTLISRAGELKASVVVLGGGQYKVQYRVPSSGFKGYVCPYHIGVRLQGQHIPRSPFLSTICDSGCDTLQCDFESSFASETRCDGVCGGKEVIRVMVRDVNGKALWGGNENVVVHVFRENKPGEDGDRPADLPLGGATSEGIGGGVGASKEQGSSAIPPQLQVNGWSPDKIVVPAPNAKLAGKGTYTFPIDLQKVALYTFHVFVDGMELQTSPVSHIPFKAGPCVTENMRIEGAGTTQAAVDVPATFTVHARDRHGNETALPDMNALKVSIAGPLRVRPTMKVLTYSSAVVEFKTSLSGVYNIAVLCNGTHVRGSEFTCTCLTSATVTPDTADAAARQLVKDSGRNTSQTLKRNSLAGGTRSPGPTGKLEMKTQHGMSRGGF